MKKALWLIAGLGMVFMLSCATTGGSSGAEPSATAGNLGAFNLVLADNFEYGDGYQGVVNRPNLMEGHRIQAGETYTLKITYSTSRDLEQDLSVGLVDVTPTANYWTALSWGTGEDMFTIPASKAGEEVSVEFTMTTQRRSTGAAPAANSVVFTTKGAGTPGAANSGTQRAVTLAFTEFVLTRH